MKIFTKEHRDNISRALTGKKLSLAHRKKLSDIKKGKIPPCTFTRRSYKGRNNPFFGKEHTEEIKNKISLLNKGKHYSIKTEFKKGELSNEKHNQWKGNDAKYCSIHSWIIRKLGSPKKCSLCGFISENNRQFHWANIDHKYKRDLKDWIRLCVKCHKKYDRENNQ